MLTYADATGVPGKTTAGEDVVEVRYVEVMPGDRVEEVDFVSDDPRVAGTMTMTWTVTSVAAWTRVDITAEDVPDGISAVDHAAVGSSHRSRSWPRTSSADLPTRLAVPERQPVRNSAQANPKVAARSPRCSILHR